MNEKKIGILGAGGQADEAISYLKDDIGVEFQAINEQFIDNTRENQVNILTPTEYQKNLEVVAAIGAPAIRRAMVESWSGGEFTVIESDMAYIDKSVKIGEGSIIAPRAVITTNVEIGSHCIINVASTISHNSRLGTYVTVGPGAHIGGNVELGDGVFVGIGAVINNGIKVASGSVIGAGAVVIRDITTENSVAVGIPAETIKVNTGWLDHV